MGGTAYNPQGFEPDAHERFFAPPKEVIEHWRKAYDEHRKKSKPVTYDEVQEYRRRGESHALGHYAME